MSLYLNRKRLALSPQNSLGKGGEADIFALGNDLAVKVFKGPDHPDLAGDATAQDAARRRLERHQAKLPAFPRNLPPTVVGPQDLCTDSAGRQILGYTMRRLSGMELLTRYADRTFREAGTPAATVTTVFLDLGRTLTRLHGRGIVIGDFNDLNVLTDGRQAWLIDTDSFQFGGFPCEVFTLKFLDPLLMGASAGQVTQVAPFSTTSDWFAFAAMLLEALVFVAPYGGLHRPADPTKRVPQLLRPLQGISIFHPEVRYPVTGLPLEALPDEWLQELQRLFDGKHRAPWPLHLLESVRWSLCSQCGLEHARAVCPRCHHRPPAPPPPVFVQGVVTVQLVRRSSGVFCSVGWEGGALRWVEAADGILRTETGPLPFTGNPDPSMRICRTADETFIGRDGTVFRLRDGTTDPRILAVDTADGQPQIAAADGQVFWLQGGTLWKDAPLAPLAVGRVLQHQTRFWLGAGFGFGFYRAGELAVAFVFNADGTGFSDRVDLPRLRGQLIGAACFFGSDEVWFLTHTRWQGHLVARAVVIRKDGAVVAVAEEEDPHEGWLASLTGKTAAGRALLAATEDGIVRLERRDRDIVETRRFEGTTPLASPHCRLIASPDALYVIDAPRSAS